MTRAFDRRRDQLVAALEDHLRTGKPVAVPEAGRLMWRAFVELSGARQHGPHGPQPIAFVEIEAYSRLMGLPFEPHHVAAIRAMDAAFMAHAAEALRVAMGRG